ncbi:MAG: hypothetical protein ACRD5H_03870 [Nitrososphaerales archaeon]
MKTDASVILLEFNELTPELMYRFMADDKLPNFQRLYREAQVYLTDAEEEPPNLNPWVQWVTVHSGLPFSEHKVFYLDDGYKLKQKCIWDLLSDANLEVWVCGSMNARYDLPLNGAVLPDPWTTGVSPYPDELFRYFKFIQRSVQEHTNDRVTFGLSDYLEFLSFMFTHGLSFSTVRSIVEQLVREHTSRFRWKRTVIMDKLQWDLFRWYYRKRKPRFSTFFLNSTAHLQHKYWRDMEPWHFKIRPSAEKQAERETAILFGYQQMDRLVGGFLDLAGDNTTVILATALSQQPCLIYEEDGGKCFYRPRNFEDLLAFAGVTEKHTVSPVMSEEFQLRFENERDAHVAAQRLQALQVAGQPALLVEVKGSEIYSGCSIHKQLPHDSFLRISNSNKSSPFFEIFYQAEGIKSGMHHRNGLLWIRRPDRKHSVYKEKVSLCSVAPTILSIFNVPRPGYMSGQCLT